MPGRRNRNLRLGDLNEEYGLFMLRLLGAVAPVPRTEDVGIDVFLTLLHEDGPTFFAGKTCVVQLKSNSMETIPFSAREEGGGPSEFDWLKGLEYPLLFGRVSVGTPLKLYSSNNLRAWLIDNPNARAVTVCFEVAREVGPNADGTPACIWLGSPIATLTVEEAANSETRASRIELLSQWIDVLSENIQNSAFGVFLEATWQENGLPLLNARRILAREPTEEESQVIMRDVGIRLMRLFQERIYHAEETDLEHLLGLLVALDRDCTAVTFGEAHQRFAQQSIERLAARRQEYRRTRAQQGVANG